MSELNAVNEICKITDPLHWSPEKTKLMVDACRELAIYHSKKNDEIASLYKT